MGILRVLFILLEVLVLFNFIILVHELGHFLAARWRGLYVDRFAIWFGKPLWKKTIGEVTYQLGSIPAGGFVSLPQLSPMEWIEGKSLPSGEPLKPASPIDKMIVVLAGPLFSLGLAFVFGAIVWWVGQPVGEGELTTTIGYVASDSTAAEAGLKAGDKIVAIDGIPVTRWGGTDAGSVEWRIVASENPTIKMDLLREGRPVSLEVAPKKAAVSGWKRSGLRELAITPEEAPMVGEVFDPSPAMRAGLRANDLLRSVDGITLRSSVQFYEHLQKGGTNVVRVALERKGQNLEVQVQPEMVLREGMTNRTAAIGIRWDQLGRMSLAHPTPWKQVKGFVSGMYNTLSALTSRKSDIKAHHLGGPVQILRVYYLLFESPQGWRLAIWFSVFMNVNLAILNLLPIPMLDGGHFVLAVAEWIRRRPLSEPVIRWVQTVGAVAVLGFMLYVTSFDLGELFQSSRRSKTAEKIKFEATPPAAPTPTLPSQAEPVPVR